MTQPLQQLLDQAWEDRANISSGSASPEVRDAVAHVLEQLDAGTLRVAEKIDGSWHVNQWVKKAVLLSFRLQDNVVMPAGGGLQFYDKVPTKFADYTEADFIKGGFRVVPPAVARRGSFIGRNVVLMPSYVNIGAYVDDGTMVDSHALIGSCAQIGRNCHISAASQMGGVLEPVGALPVIIEDDVLIGGNCGVYEGTVVKHRAVLGSGTILNRSTPIYDLVRGTVHRATENSPLIVPPEAVVVAGSRNVASGPGKDWGISLYTPVIVKYRDAATEAKIQLEDLLR